MPKAATFTVQVRLTKTSAQSLLEWYQYVSAYGGTFELADGNTLSLPSSAENMLEDIVTQANEAFNLDPEWY